MGRTIKRRGKARSGLQKFVRVMEKWARGGYKHKFSFKVKLGGKG